MDTKPLKEPALSPTATGGNEALLFQRVVDLEQRIARFERDASEVSSEPALTGQPSVPVPPIGVQDLLFIVKQLDGRIVSLEQASTEGAVSLRRHLLGIVSFIETQHDL